MLAMCPIHMGVSDGHKEVTKLEEQKAGTTVQHLGVLI